MTDNTNAPAYNTAHQGALRTDAGSEVTTEQQPNRPLLLNAEHISPLQWWRTLPPDALNDAEQARLLDTMERISVLHAVDDLKAALAGDAVAAIDVAFSLMPIEEITLAVDIGMTALCRCALARNSSASLVMAQVIGVTNLDHGLSIDLAMSWYSLGLRHASNPCKFREAKAVPLKAFQYRDRPEAS